MTTSDAAITGTSYRTPWKLITAAVAVFALALLGLAWMGGTLFDSTPVAEPQAVRWVLSQPARIADNSETEAVESGYSMRAVGMLSKDAPSAPEVASAVRLLTGARNIRGVEGRVLVVDVSGEDRETAQQRMATSLSNVGRWLKDWGG